MSFLFVILIGAVTVLLGKYINNVRTVRLHVKRKRDFKPKVSVMIPTWNEERVIEGTIRNIEKSFYNDFEIIVVDDRSTDNTLKILEELQNEYDNLKVVVKKGIKGKAQSINEAMEIASGDIVLFMDADARIPPTYISTHVSCFSSDDIRMIFTDFEAYNYKGNVTHEIQEIFFDFVRDVIYSNIFLRMIFMGNGIFFRRELLDKILPIDPTTIVDDFSMATKLSRLGVREYFSVYPKIRIQYVNGLKDLWKQHMRWYYGGFREIVKLMKRGDPKAFGLFAFSIAFFIGPFILILLGIFLHPVCFYIVALLVVYVYSVFVFSELFRFERKVKFTSIFALPFFIMAFELSVIIPAMFKSLVKEEDVWHKVERDEA